MVALALISYALLAWLRLRLALGVLLVFVPFGHLVRFDVVEIPFTFPETATYVLAVVIVLQTFFSSFLRQRRTRLWRGASSQSGEKSHTRAPSSNDVRSLCSGLGMTKWWGDAWFLLPFLWILVATVSAVYSPNVLRAWGIWKAYFVAPVLLFWVTRWMFLQRRNHAHAPPPSIGTQEQASPYFNGREKMVTPHTNLSRVVGMNGELHAAVPSSNGVRSLSASGRIEMTRDAVMSLLLPLTASAILVAALAILQRWFPIGVPYPWSVPGKFRATSVFGYPNAVGLYLAPLVPLFVGVAFAWRTPTPSHSPSLREGEKKVFSPPPSGRGGVGGWSVRAGFIGTATLAIVAIALARSTGALVALAVVLPISFAVQMWCTRHHRTDLTDLHDRESTLGGGNRRRRAMGWTAVIVVGWVAASFVLTAWLPYRRERTTWGSPIVQKLTFQRWSGSVRLSQYRETWQLLRDHPIRGAGLAGYQHAIRPYHEDQRVEIFLYPHNLLLAVWVELGLAGFLLFLAILHFFFRQLFTLHSSLFTSSIAAAMLVLLIHGFVDVPYFKNDLAMLFWVIVALGTRVPAFDTIRTYGRSIANGLPPSAPGHR